MKANLLIPSRLFLLVAAPIVAVAGLVGFGLLLGLLLAGPDDVAAKAEPAAPTAQNEHADRPARQQMYTCAMHPQVRLPDPDAKCPICFMDLIPVQDTDEDLATLGEPVLSMSPAAARLAEIETTPVRRLLPQVEVRMVGKIDYDETRLATISAYIPGRLDQLFVDYTGVPVQKGDHLVSIYSPELFSAEAELLSNLEAFTNLDEAAGKAAREIAGANVQASRDKLRLWGLSTDQIRSIEHDGQISDHMTIYAPIGGVVIRKHKTEGEYVNTGEPIYSVADLSHLWVRLDAYESDLRWVRYGQDVEFTTEAFPGEVFHGTIAFIDPNVSPETRTVKLRLNVANPDGRLKPGMFVRAVVRPVIAGEGEVVATDLAGRFVCPMHPEVVKDEPGTCDICGMDLLPAEQLGYVAAANGHAPPLVISATAPLITGKRAIVYVQLPDREQPTFEGREIALGPRAGDYYLVREDVPGGPNLAEGDLVVVHGNFKIDSALQIQARRSMMSPPPPESPSPPPAASSGEAAPAVASEPGPIASPPGFISSLTALYEGYLHMQQALAADQLPAFQDAAREMHAALDAVDGADLEAQAATLWTDVSARLATDREHIDHLADLDAARVLFETYSGAMIDLARGLGHAGDTPVNIVFCPMAFDFKGASWLQTGDEINNPYFGSEMLRCGTIKGAIAAAPSRPGEDRDE